MRLTDLLRDVFRSKNPDYVNPASIESVLKTWEDKGHRYKKRTLIIDESKSELSLEVYLEQLADLQFTAHESEMRYGGQYYLLGEKANVWLRLVPTIGLRELPRKWRHPRWYHATIVCLKEDTRFDTFPAYTTIAIPIGRYPI